MLTANKSFGNYAFFTATRLLQLFLKYGKYYVENRETDIVVVYT